MEKLERKETATRIRMISNGMRKPRIVSILRSLGKKDDRNLLHLLGLVQSEDNFLKFAWKKRNIPFAETEWNYSVFSKGVAYYLSFKVLFYK